MQINIKIDIENNEIHITISSHGTLNENNYNYFLEKTYSYGTLLIDLKSKDFLFLGNAKSSETN